MRAIIALILAFAITANCSLLKAPVSVAPVLSLVQIDQHPLGKSLISLAALHMKAQGPLQDLPILLQQIYDDLSVQYQENENIHDQRVQYCTETIAALRAAIRRLGQSYALHQSVQFETEDALVRHNAHLESVIAAIADNEHQTEEGKALRTSQHELYVVDLADNIDAIEASKEAIQLLNALRAGTSFVQLKNKFQKVSEKLDNTKNSKHAHIYTPIIKALAQISSKADKEAIGKILELLTNLLSQLESARATIETTEATQAAAWATKLGELEAEHAFLVQDKADTEATIEEKEEILADALEQQEAALKQLENNTINLTNTQAECKAWEESYQTIRAELEREQEIVAAIQAHFESKLAGLQEYIDNAPAAF
jgi:flagellin-specific chaperone FliS